MLMWLLVIVMNVSRAAAGTYGFDATLGFPGEGPVASSVRVDEASGGMMEFFPILATTPQEANGSAGGLPRQRGPRCRKSDKEWSIVTANVTSWARAETLLTDCTD